MASQLKGYICEQISQLRKGPTGQEKWACSNIRVVN